MAPGMYIWRHWRRNVSQLPDLFPIQRDQSHAAMSPHLGRSALDAVTLFNVGIQFLREHVLPTVRMHYAVTDTGGFSPNVVQPTAEVLCLLRAPENGILADVRSRVEDIARGAALMTGTELEIDFVKACSNCGPQ